MLDIQKIIDKITRIKKLKMKSFEIIFDELDEVISELLDMKKEIEEIERKKANDNSDSNLSLNTDDIKAITDSDSDYSFNADDNVEALRYYVKHLKE